MMAFPAIVAATVAAAMTTAVQSIVLSMSIPLVDTPTPAYGDGFDSVGAFLEQPWLLVEG